MMRKEMKIHVDGENAGMEVLSDKGFTGDEMITSMIVLLHNITRTTGLSIPKVLAYLQDTIAENDIEEVEAE